jgi:omega-6 fatty acid desaturase (delta-12 desaturase)
MRTSALRAAATVALVALQMGVAISFAAYVWQAGLLWLWPVSWMLTGFTLTAVFVLAHDCAHFSLFRTKWINSLIGHVCFAPALYPFYAWKYAHDAHHKYTNQLNPEHRLYDENTWLLETLEEYTDREIDVPLPRWLYWLTRVNLPVGSILYLVKFLFQPKLLRPAHRPKVYRSYLFLALFVPCLAALVYVASGRSLTGVLHFWVLPTIFLQIWMVTYTYLQHTAVDARFYEPSQWTPFRGRAIGTLNVLFPRWISFLHLNIDVHIPHHLSPNIPCYRLREANAALRESPYAPIMNERRFSLAYYYRQWRDCNLWDTTTGGFASFADARRRMGGQA